MRQSYYQCFFTAVCFNYFLQSFFTNTFYNRFLLLGRLISGEDRFGVCRILFIVLVACDVEILKSISRLDTIVDDKPRHHTACFFSKKRDQFIFAIFLVAEYGADQFCVQLVRVDDLEVLIRCEIDNQWLSAVFSSSLIESVM